MKQSHDSAGLPGRKLKHLLHQLCERAQDDVRRMASYEESATHQLPHCSDDATWQPVWDGARPAERHEHFWLFRRAPGAATCTGSEQLHK